MTPIEEGGDGLSELLSSVNVADPRGAPQLLQGFYPLEEGTWRWTAKSFSVILAPLPPVPGYEPELNLVATLPDPLRQYLPITLSAEINGNLIGAHVFKEVAQEQLITIPIPDGILTQEPAIIEWTMDKALPPTEADGRELGMVVVSVAIK